jgi:hypothetical protein
MTLSQFEAMQSALNGKPNLLHHLGPIHPAA